MRLVLLLLLELCSVTVIRCYMAIWLQGDRPKARNITVFPPCLSDQDCAELSSIHLEDYRCFHYMCYPWRRRDTGFRRCLRSSDCLSLEAGEGGSGLDGTCWRHSDRRNVHSGLCLDTMETVSCYDHSDCSDRLRCVAGYCGDGEYLEALGEQQCEDHHLCDDLLLGPDCCFDIAGGVEKIASGDLTSPWGKKCCDNIRSPITQPSENLTAEIVKKLDQKIQELYSPWGLDAVVCEGLQYDTITRLTACQDFTTSTTTRTVRTTVRTSTSRTDSSVTGSSHQRDSSGSVRNYLDFTVLTLVGLFLNYSSAHLSC